MMGQFSRLHHAIWRTLKSANTCCSRPTPWTHHLSTSSVRCQHTSLFVKHSHFNATTPQRTLHIRTTDYGVNGSTNMISDSHKKRQYSTGNPTLCCPITTRSLIRISGKDSRDFLQGLLTNDMRVLDNESDEGDRVRAIYSMMLNIQGRVMYDLMLYRQPPEADLPVYLMECDRQITAELLQTMKRYKIRKKVTMTDVSDEYKVWSLLPADGSTDDLTLTFTKQDDVVLDTPDPRLSVFGHRLILRDNTNVSAMLPGGVEMSDEVDYTRRRYTLGLSEGVVDLPPGNCTPLESNAVFLNGVSFTKGCYIGQELTARTHHTGVIRKRILPITIHGDSTDLKPGATIENAKGKNCGKLRSFLENRGLALLRIPDVIGKGTLVAKNDDGKPIIDIETQIPSWWPRDCDEIIKQSLSTLEK